MKRQKIAIACFTGQSGLTDYSICLARALSTSASVTLFTAKNLPDRFSELGFETVKVFRRSRHYPIDIIKFILQLLKHKPDILLLQAQLKIPLLETLVVKLISAAGIRVALTVHDVLPHYPKPWSRIEFSIFYKAFDLLITHSQQAKQKLAQMGIKKPILVVPHGVYDIFKIDKLTQEQAREKFPTILSTDTVVLFFGHLEPRKGLPELLTVATELQASEPGIKFLIAGGNAMGTHSESDAQQLAQCKALKNAIIHDSRIPFEEVQYYFAASDIVAMPYREGTTSGVLKLAIAFGLPAIVTRIGDLPEELPQGAGEVIEAGATVVTELKRSILHIKENLPHFKKAMEASSDHAQWETISKKYLDFLIDQNIPKK